jgi:multimeric flavodoxin WrbA
MGKTLVILGTNRDESNTLKALKENLPFADYQLVELHKFKLQHYTYDRNNKPNDDFLSIASKMTEVENIVFATPVYWYAMSGVMKIFFDRLSELISTSKPLGRALSGKSVYLFSTGSELEMPDGFEVPFKRTSEYFEMKYVKSIYVSVKD